MAERNTSDIGFEKQIWDPACGSGGMFVQSAKFIENHGGNINRISVFGQDSNPTTWKMAQMNLAIRGIEADLGKFSADTFFNDCHPQLKVDFIMANPPLAKHMEDILAYRTMEYYRRRYTDFGFSNCHSL